MRSVMAREDFREAVFARDSHTCVVPWCQEKAQDAHHIIERALWKAKGEQGGYFPDNGVSLCGLHHKHAEADYFPPTACRIWAGIEQRVLPQDLDPSSWYTKWGEIIKSALRQKVKYPSIPYLPFSPRKEDRDDIINLNTLLHKPLVPSIKMDGSNACVTNDCVAARNVLDATHKSWSYLKAVHPRFAHLIPDRIQLFGEWVYAKHSIHYQENLDGFLQLFDVYDQRNQLFADREEVSRYAKLIGAITPEVLVTDPLVFDNIWELEAKITRMAKDVIAKGHEGIVLRSIYPLHYGQFEDNIAKYVRKDHVQTNRHWRDQPIVRNVLRKKGP